MQPEDQYERPVDDTGAVPDNPAVAGRSVHGSSSPESSSQGEAPSPAENELVDSEAEKTEDEQKSPELWDDPGMPWRRKPERKDMVCLTWIGIMGVFSLLLIPLRAWLLGSPDRLVWLVALIGSRSGTAALASVVRVGGDQPFVWPILLGALISIKLDWTYWWAGKLWGRGMIEIWAGQSERSARNYTRVERWANKLGWLGMFVAYAPIPLPIGPVVFVLAGAQGMGVKKFLLLDFVASLTWLIGYFSLGYAVGEPAVVLLHYYSKIALYVAGGLTVVIVALSFWRSYRKGAAGESR